MRDHDVAASFEHHPVIAVSAHRAFDAADGSHPPGARHRHAELKRFTGRVHPHGRDQLEHRVGTDGDVTHRLTADAAALIDLHAQVSAATAARREPMSVPHQSASTMKT